jgi:uncharacterized protein YjbI with pentapeptide repeats
MSRQQRWIASAFLFAASFHSAAARADIFRWDNGQLIPGTEGITPGPATEIGARVLQFAELSNTNLTRSSFYDNRMLHGSDLTGARFNNADLSYTVLTASNLSGAAFAGATVIGTNLHVTQGFTKVQLYSTASYRAKDLHEIQLGRINLTGWELSGQDLTGAIFSHSTLTDTNLAGAYLTNAYFDFATLTNTDLSGTNLTNAYLSEATLTNANLSFADSRGAFELNLTGAITTNLIRPDGRISGLNLSAGEKLTAYAGVPIPVQVSGGFSIAPTATFDLTDNDAIVQSTTANKAADFARLYDHVKQGYDGGDWQGTGITSSTAAADANRETTLALADNALLGYTEFSGQVVTADSILLKYIYYGDIDVNGQVDADDLTVFANNFGRATGAVQIDGDVDFDNDVDADDLTVFASNFGKGIGGPLSAGTVAAIPEPTSLVLAGLAAVAALAVMRTRRTGRMSYQ